ncbi:histidine phosphatase family protein [Desmonostoc muscorum LEGE 12446]|uniref:histidine phosphatase family protein n=1 Tax=Desmonostoc muscorum TaxID=1179 RepID=UPI001D15592F|nr:phosphoglycerate mutase family protein [Desmonostoc muscorum]MCF2146466.1 histidine phosphatase family protein [Desmonostoc muscorum LEGE 12446]
MASSQVVENNHQQGKVYFIRHGESTSNERNIFAGVLDVDLTAFGRLQARQAGSDLKKKGVKFDAVYVSHMRRARQTCEIALAESQALKSPDTPIHIDHRISEKSFGIFAGCNLNLLRLACNFNCEVYSLWMDITEMGIWAIFNIFWNFVSKPW